MNTQKKLMLLGGIRYLIPAINVAHKLGVYVITADYLPDNIAHKYSDEYVNVSIIDREAVLKVAQEKQIDGILSFGVDPGVVTAAYVADKMGLPSPPLESVEILQNKDKFRDFLEQNGFNCPFHKGYTAKETALADAETFPYPIIVKPVDSAGSKGVTRVNTKEDLPNAIDIAFSETHNGHIIIEQFLELIGYQSGSDSFSINNELVFLTFDNQHFDATSPNAYAPIAHSWPSTMSNEVQLYFANELQRLIKLLNLGTSIYNIEARVAMDGKPYIMEVSPRAGGNRLSEVLEIATQQPIIENNIRFSLGMPLLPMSPPQYNGVWVDFVIHTNKSGKFKHLQIEETFARQHLIEKTLFIHPDDEVVAFNGANQSLGTLFLKFDSYQDAFNAIKNPDQWLTLEIQ